MHMISAFRGLIPNVHVWATMTISSGKLKLCLNNVLQNMYLPLGMNISTKYLKMDSGSSKEKKCQGLLNWKNVISPHPEMDKCAYLRSLKTPT